LSEQTICYIDDNKTNLLLIKKAFEKQHKVELLDSPVHAVDFLRETKPDLVLLDVNMPTINGYELCRAIRNTPELEHVPVVFLTCRSSLEDRLTGFEAGGDAYVTKPFEIAELTHIVRTQLTRYQQLKKVESKAKSASTMVWTMLQNNSEIGQVVQYARTLSNIRDASDLLKATFSTLNEFGLNSTLLIGLTSGEIVARSDKKPFTPIETELLNLAKHGERIVHVGNKYVFSGHHCVFLINNMPSADEELTGRLRDHVAIMLESCDACVELINYRKTALQLQQKAASRTQSTVTQEFKHVISSFQALNQHSDQTFEKLTSAIEKSFLFLELTEEQEAELMTYIEESRKDNDQIKRYGLTLQEALNRVANSIHQLTGEYQESGDC